MKTKTLKLTQEEAIQYYNSSNDKGFKALLEKEFGVGFWKPKEITSEVFNMDTLFNKLPDFIPPYDLDTTDDFEKYLNACAILAKVAEVYNEETKLDWKNTNVYKYIPYKYFSGGSYSVGTACSWFSYLCASARLYYKNTKLSEASYNNFKQYWEDYWSFQG